MNYMQHYVQAPRAYGYATGAEQIVGVAPGYPEIVGQAGPVPCPVLAPHLGPMAGPHPAMPPHPAMHPHHPHHHPWWGHGHFMPGPAPIYGPAPFFAAPPGGGIAYGGAPAVVERPLRDMREFPLGFFQSGISTIMGAIDVISRPQIVFRGERLVVPSSIAADFALIDIKVGNRSQLANSTALPAQVFQENAVGVRLALDTAVVAQDIALIVENVSISGSAETFIAALIGTAAQ